MEEIWKPIPGYEGRYEVSSHGRVRSVGLPSHLPGIQNRGIKVLRRSRILAAARHKTGYMNVVLSDASFRRRTTMVHRLVALVFIPNPQNLPFVNHKDEDKANNRVENLEWCTRQYNNNYGSKNERTSKSVQKPVAQYTMDGTFVASYPSSRAAQAATGIYWKNIGKVASHQPQHKSAGGYIWKYLPKHKTL